MRKKAILRLLSSRSGEISEPRRKQVMEAGLDDLNVWFDRALTAGDVDAVFGGAAEGYADNFHFVNERLGVAEAVCDIPAC